MTEKELQGYLLATYPKEDESCEWKEFKNLTHAFSGNKGDDSASRQELERLVLDKLSNALDEGQKKNKFRNILYSMSVRDKTIEKSGSKRKGQWTLTSIGKEQALVKLRQT